MLLNMRRSSFILLLCLVSACRGQYLYKGTPQASDHIKEYEGSNPDEFFDSSKPGFVEYYSPHCGHCRQFAATYVELAKQTFEKSSNIQFYAVSCGSYLDYCRKVGVKGYPSFFKIDGKTEPQYVKSGTRGVDSAFVLSLFDQVAAVEDTSAQFKATVSDLKEKPEVLPAPPATVSRLGIGRLNPSTGKVEEIPSAGATNAMKANIKGTPEEQKRKEAILESIRRAKGKRQAEQVKTLMETTDVLPFRKVVPVVQMREKIPLIQRTVKLSLEEELIIDTAVSFAFSLKYDVFLRGQPLSESETKALRDWLVLLSVSLPQEWVLTSLVDDVLRQVDELAKNPALLSKLLKSHQIVRTRWSPSCGGRSGRFTCGFWKLLHTVSVGVAEHRGGKTVFSQSFNAFSPAEAADIIREFIANFFRCRECAAHFIATFDDCSFERCERLVDGAVTASDSDWKELAVWLWKFHNSVNVRVYNERNKNGVKKAEDEIRVVWPTLADCWTCYREDGTWDENAIFLQLERSYWPGAEIDSRTARLLSFASQIQPPHSIRIYAILCLLILLVAYRSTSAFVKGAIYGPKRAD